MGSKASDLFEDVKEFFKEPPPVSTEDFVNPEIVLKEQHSGDGGVGWGVVPPPACPPLQRDTQMEMDVVCALGAGLHVRPPPGWD